jgi:hypothetical protein
MTNDTAVHSMMAAGGALVGFDRAIALGGASLNQAVRARVEAAIGRNGRDVRANFDEALSELSKLGAISSDERALLTKIAHHVFEAERGKGDPEEAFLAIRAIHNEMALDHRRSPVSLAIAGIALSSFKLDKSSPLKVNPVAGAAGGLIGAATGAGIGFGIGGPIGGAIGGVIGGAIGAVVGLCG